MGWLGSIGIEFTVELAGSAETFDDISNETLTLI
jgi:hypothetical protein